MLVALINGILGVTLSLVIGTRILDLQVDEILVSVLSSITGALISVLITLQAEQVKHLRERFLNRSYKAWTLLLGIYFGIEILLAPVLHNATTFLYLCFPLILTTGFAIAVFGPIQDALVRKRQRKTRLLRIDIFHSIKRCYSHKYGN